MILRACRRGQVMSTGWQVIFIGLNAVTVPHMIVTELSRVRQASASLRLRQSSSAARTGVWAMLAGEVEPVGHEQVAIDGPLVLCAPRLYIQSSHLTDVIPPSPPPVTRHPAARRPDSRGRRQRYGRE